MFIAFDREQQAAIAELDDGVGQAGRTKRGWQAHPPPFAEAEPAVIRMRQEDAHRQAAFTARVEERRARMRLAVYPERCRQEMPSLKLAEINDAQGAGFAVHAGAWKGAGHARPAAAAIIRAIDIDPFIGAVFI